MKLQRLKLQETGRVTKAEPVRTCRGCGRKFAKKNLVRFCLAGKEVVVDPEAKAQGRGAYCCRDRNCLELFIKNKKRVSRAFRAEISGFRVELASIFRSRE